MPLASAISTAKTAIKRARRTASMIYQGFCGSVQCSNHMRAATATKTTAKMRCRARSDTICAQRAPASTPKAKPHAT